MSVRYHVNPETGNPNKCNATVKCPFGGEEAHFSTKQDAAAHFEKSQGNQTSSISKNRPQKIRVSERFPQWGQLPDFPDGRTFDQVWDEKFSELYEWRKENPGENPSADSSHALKLLPVPPYAIRERSIILIPKDKLKEETDVDPDSVKGDYVLELHTRQGGGNRDCWCDDEEDHESDCLSKNNDDLQSNPNYLTDIDDSDDSTYATFYFDGVSKKDAEKYFEDRNTGARLSILDRLEKAVQEKSMTPWGALADDTHGSRNAITKYRNSKHLLERQLKDEAENERKLSICNTLMRSAARGKVTNADLLAIGNLPAYAQQSIVRDSKELVAKKATYEKISKAMETAKNLEEGPLKDYLLGDRGSFTYAAKEKVGRRNVTVQRTVERGSLLNSELDEATRYMESAKRSLARSLKPIEETKENLLSKVTNTDKLKEKVKVEREEAWKAGWYSSKKAIPEIPEDF